MSKKFRQHCKTQPIRATIKQTSHSKRTVQEYLPAIRPYYNVNPSKNAIRIRHYCQKIDSQKSSVIYYATFLILFNLDLLFKYTFKCFARNFSHNSIIV